MTEQNQGQSPSSAPEADDKLPADVISPAQKPDTAITPPIASPVSQQKVITFLAGIPTSMWVAIFLIAAAWAWASERFPRSEEQLVTRIVVVNPRVLLEAASAQMAATGQGSPEQMVQRIKTIVEGYSAAGYVTLNSGYLVHWPDSIDITPAVANELGIDLAANKPISPVPMERPAVQPAPASSPRQNFPVDRP